MLANLFSFEKKPEQDSKLLEESEIVESRNIVTLFFGMCEIPEAKLFLMVMSIRNLLTFFVAISLKFREFNWYTKFL